MAEISSYEGEKPYIFISYAHANAPAVMEVLRELGERGFRLWYDEGIEVGSEWPEYIAQHLAGSGLMIAFLSNAYMRSENCRREMHYALTKRIPVVNIFLEETQMTPGMELQTGNLFALMKYSMGDEAFYEKLFAAPQLAAEAFSDGAAPAKKRRAKRRKRVPVDLTVEAKKQKKRKVRRIVRLSVLGLVLAACVTLGIIGYSTGLAQRLLIKHRQAAVEALPGDTPVSFTEPLLEQAAREYAGLPEGALCVADLAGLTELYLVGDKIFFSEPAEAAAGEGSLRDLADLRYFTGLETLSLADQPLHSLESLPACGIEYLSVTGCPVTSLQGVGKLPRLREINTADCPIRELGDLGNCLQLRRMSLIGSNIADFSAVKPLTRLAEVELSSCGINELRPLLGLSSLTDLAFYDCDLRGSFFKVFDRERAVVSLSLVDCKLNSTANLNDFKGLTTLRLIRTGENLDWAALAELPALKTVYIDPGLESAVRVALAGTDVNVVTEQ